MTLYKLAPSLVNTRNQSLLIFLRVCISSYRMASKNRQQLIRPLLGLDRYNAMRLCTNWCLPVYPDVTNEKLQFLRNRLRKQLLPLLRCSLNPQIDKNLFQSSEFFLCEQLRTETSLSKLYWKRENDNCIDRSTTQLNPFPSKTHEGGLVVTKALCLRGGLPQHFLTPSKDMSAIEPIPPRALCLFFKAIQRDKDGNSDSNRESTNQCNYLFLPRVGSCVLVNLEPCIS